MVARARPRLHGGDLSPVSREPRRTLRGRGPLDTHPGAPPVLEALIERGRVAADHARDMYGYAEAAAE